jgi:hypothetical protein
MNLGGWSRRVREVGDAFLGVVRAEIAEFVGDLSRSGRALVRAMAIVAAAAGIAFWTLGLAIYFAVELLALSLPRWGAVGVVLAIFVLLAAALGLVARRRLRAIESPAATVQRRLADSQRWWRERVAADEPDEAALDEGEDAGDR